MLADRSFPKVEFNERLQRVRVKMQSQGLDG